MSFCVPPSLPNYTVKTRYSMKEKENTLYISHQENSLLCYVSISLMEGCIYSIFFSWPVVTLHCISYYYFRNCSGSKNTLLFKKSELSPCPFNLCGGSVFHSSLRIQFPGCWWCLPAGKVLPSTLGSRRLWLLQRADFTKSKRKDSAGKQWAWYLIFNATKRDTIIKNSNVLLFLKNAIISIFFLNVLLVPKETVMHYLNSLSLLL